MWFGRTESRWDRRDSRGCWVTASSSHTNTCRPREHQQRCARRASPVPPRRGAGGGAEGSCSCGPAPSKVLGLTETNMQVEARGARLSLRSPEKRGLDSSLCKEDAQERAEKERTACTALSSQGPPLAGKRARFRSGRTVPKRGVFPGKTELMACHEPAA